MEHSSIKWKGGHLNPNLTTIEPLVNQEDGRAPIPNAQNDMKIYDQSRWKAPTGVPFEWVHARSICEDREHVQI